MNRDMGIRGGAGKGDNDRTSDVETFRENLAEIPLHPEDKTGFTQVATGRFRKSYGKTEADHKAEPAPVPATPAPLMPAARAARGALGGASEN